MVSLMAGKCVAPNRQGAKKFFLCVFTSLRESFPHMADRDPRPDTGKSFRQSKRELFVMLAVWGVAFVWVITYCTFNSYSIDLTFNIPWLSVLAVAAHACWFVTTFRGMDKRFFDVAACGQFLMIITAGVLWGVVGSQLADTSTIFKFTFVIPANTELQLVWGIPAWAFYGWVLPLMAANAFTLWFCLKFMQDEPMEELPEEDNV